MMSRGLSASMCRSLSLARFEHSSPHLWPSENWKMPKAARWPWWWCPTRPKATSTSSSTSPSHILQAKSRLQDWHRNSLQSVHFHDLSVPSFSTPSPKPGALSSHIQPLRDALIAHLREPLASLLRSLSAASHRLIIIYNTLVSVAAQEAMAFSNAEIYSFRSTLASFLLSFIFAAASSQGKPDAILASLEGCFTIALIDFILMNRCLRATVQEARIGIFFR